MNTELARFNMIEQQIRPWQVLDPAVLALLAAVKREDFVPQKHRALAFVDTQVPLLDDPDGPCMLEPKVEARLLQELRVQHTDRVLEIGTGSGFMAALLAHRAQSVTTVETLPELADRARQNLQHAGLGRVKVLQGDGAATLPVQGPWDVILLSGSVAELPQALLQQLKTGGRLAAVVGIKPIMRAIVATRVGEKAWSQTEIFDTVAPRLQGFPEPSTFRF
jgi:protein-L-isoaspartate(D-aspartate) O-methyltransferase